MKYFFLAVVFYLTFVSLSAQPEVTPWANIRGIRVDGELFEINSSLGFIGTDWSSIRKTAKERASYSYERLGAMQNTPVRIDSFFYDQSVEYLGAGRTNVRIHFRSEKDTNIIGAFWMLEIPHHEYPDGEIKLLDPTYGPLAHSIPNTSGEIIRGTSRGISLHTVNRTLSIEIDQGMSIIVRRDTDRIEAPIEIYFVLMSAHLKKNAEVYRSFMVLTTGMPRKSAVQLTLNHNHLGKMYKGFGGNFRLQNPSTDPPVIDYCLENLKVRWGRVEMPWRFWHPEEGTSPVKNADESGLHPRVEAAMRMAKRLDSLGMPVILSNWTAPEWAIEGKMTFGPQPGGLRGNPLDPVKLDKIYRSIGDYLEYTKEHFGFEFSLFSFNESDLGINVRQTPEEHAQFIKGLGSYLKNRGLKTKLLLGDTADANGWPFIKLAMDDPETHPFIGAVSFHSWRGYTDENLEAWAKAADRMRLPLLVGEGSMDAGAWRYPDIFSEPTYAMEEMNLYVRILRICQPESILQWQLTADYSPMIGGGVFGNDEIPLQPTQRFWNFKQLANLPQDLKYMLVNYDDKYIECTGLADPERNIYAVHLVNNGATRTFNLHGIPENLEWVKIWVTNEHSNNTRKRSIRVREGVATFTGEANSFITLVADGQSSF